MLKSLDTDLLSFKLAHFRSLTEDRFEPDAIYDVHDQLISGKDEKSTSIATVLCDKLVQDGYVCYTLKVHNKLAIAKNPIKEATINPILNEAIIAKNKPKIDSIPNPSNIQFVVVKYDESFGKANQKCLNPGESLLKSRNKLQLATSQVFDKPGKTGYFDEMKNLKL